MKIFILIALCLASIFNSALAKEVLDLNFCGKVTVEDVEKMLEKKGLNIGDKISDDELSNSIQIKVINYNIADLYKEVSFSLFKDKLYFIGFPDGHGLNGILRAKYGAPFKTISRNLGWGTVNTFYYNSNEPDIEIAESYVNGRSSISYTCKSIERQRAAVLEKLRSQKEMKKIGANGL